MDLKNNCTILFGRFTRICEVQFDNRVAIEIQIPHGTSYFVNEFIKIYKNKG